ncbi:hypothetical protein ACVH9Z_34335 [Rhodococcus opacus]|uniref:hypothetical protein n=1 Tax=Rhodococcus opacus TaxID=37919 RepID=UPI001B308FBF|nr:hypothetical protein [Rhodococcus opacus]
MTTPRPTLPAKRIDGLTRSQASDLLTELRTTFPGVHRRSVDLRRIIREAQDELARTTQREALILDSIQALSELFD